MSEEQPDLNQLTEKLIAFRDERDWRQFHSLKNLILSLNLEASELLELTQWKTDGEIEKAIGSEEFSQRAAEECADILLYLLLIAERAGIDLIAAADAKITKNAQKYPIENREATPANIQICENSGGSRSMIRLICTRTIRRLT